jgi:hypothetical protein
VLSNAQFATGSVGAAARTALINSDAGARMERSGFAVANNRTIADVSANHAVNAVSLAGPTGTESNAGLASSQMSAAAVSSSATVDGTLGLAGGPATTAIYGSSATISGNVTQATARGNSVDNSLIYTAGAGLVPFAPSVSTGSFETIAAAPAMLLNGQSNYGAVAASATGSYGIPLNASGSVASSTLTVSGNSAVASAYGNAATNQVKIGGISGAPGAMLGNVQVNNGSVTATVAGATLAARTALLSASSLSLTGNQVAATASGNIATNVVSGAH